MAIRQLDLFDLPAKLGGSGHISTYDTIDRLVWGDANPMMRIASSILPFSPRVSVFDPQRHPLLASITHHPQDLAARVSLVITQSRQDLPQAQPLITELAKIAANRGAFHLLVEVPVESSETDWLRNMGFTIYTTQVVMRPGGLISSQRKPANWVPLQQKDELAAKLLYDQLTSPLVSAVEPFRYHHGEWLMVKGAQVFARVVKGRNGVVVIPLAHPEEKIAESAFADLASYLYQPHKATLYFLLKAAMAWFQPDVLQHAQTTAWKENVMAHHMARQVMVKDPYAAVQKQPASILSPRVQK